jgi:hypothetical protein
MRRIREYEIWNCPGCPTVDPSSIVAEVAMELGFTDRAIVPHNQLPSALDCENLRMSLSEGELFIDDLAQFCSTSGYSVDPDNPAVAYHFLNYSYGQCLAWIHLEEEDDDDARHFRMYMAARRKGLALVDPEDLLCLFFNKETHPPGS